MARQRHRNREGIRGEGVFRFFRYFDWSRSE